MFGLDTNQLLMLALAVGAVLFGVPGAKDKLLEAIRNLLTPKTKVEAVSAEPVSLSECQRCFAAWETLRNHAVADGNAEAQEALTKLLPQLFPAKKTVVGAK